MEYERIKKICNPLVFNEAGQVCLVKRRFGEGADTYSTPGGKFEPGDDIYSATIRELNEEIGIEVKAADLHVLHRYLSFNSKTGKPMFHYVVVVLKYTGTPAISDNENSELIWVDIEKPNVIVSMYSQAALDTYLVKVLNKPIESLNIEDDFTKK